MTTTEFSRDVLEDVAALSFHKTDGKKQEFPQILANRLLIKRGLHAGAVEKFVASVGRISDDIEKDVLAASFELKSRLETSDLAVEAVVKELKKDDLLVQKEEDYLTASWSTMEGLLEERSGCVASMADRLEGLERGRAEKVGSEMRLLVDTLLVVAHESPGEIERLVEREAHDLNCVIIANRRAHSELIAMLDQKDVDAGLAAIEAWRSRQVAWRKLRHDRALGEFRTELNSNRFVNPPDRVKLCDEIKEQQSAGFEQERSQILKRIRATRCEQAAGGKTNADGVEECKQAFKALYDSEDLYITQQERELTSLADYNAKKAESLREDLRAELHAYAALKEEPDLEAHAVFVSLMLGREEEAAFFRSAGGLKVELRELVQEWRDPKLIYEMQLSTSSRRLEVLVSGCDLKATLEKQGKAQQQKSLQETVERLRRASRHEVAPLLPMLQHQLTELLAVNGLDPVLSEQLAICVADLKTITKDWESRGGGAGIRRGSQVSGVSGAKTSVTKKSRITRGNSQTSGMSSMTGKNSAGPEVNMLEVRSVQKRVAMHLCTSEMSAETIAELKEAQRSLERKGGCNEAVDEVISEECESLLESRKSEQASLAQKIVAFLDTQANNALDRGTRLCDFYSKVATLVQQHVSRESTIDETMLDELFELKEKLREADEIRERDVDETLDALRHAADEGELEEQFTKVLGLFNEIEAGYREYHFESTAKSREHPVQCKAEAESFEATVCSTFGLAATEGGKGDFFLSGEKKYPVVEKLERLVTEVLDGTTPVEEQEQPGEAEEYFTEGFTPLSDEDLAALEGDPDSYLNERDSRFAKLSEAALATKTPEEAAEYERVKADVDAHKAAKEAALLIEMLAQKEAAKIAPVDPSGAECVGHFDIDTTSVIEMVSMLRQVVLEEMSAISSSRSLHIDQLTSERLRDFTEVLEERLRTHWPRKGRCEVKFRQPREGELISHRQRKERHLRLISTRDAHCDRELDSFLKKSARTKCAVFEEHLERLRVALPEQRALAGLQGLESKCKKLVALFEADCAHVVEKDLEEPFLTTEPNKLLQLNDVLLKGTRLFAEGGAYSDAEAAELREQVANSKSQVNASVDRRRVKKDDLVAMQTEALARVATFHAESQQCHHELSMKEGLGVMYGAPRRNAQEKIRTAQTRDEQDATGLDDLLNLLDNRKSSNEASLLLETMDQIRQKVYTRALYLSFLPVPGSVKRNLSEEPPKLAVAAKKGTASILNADVPEEDTMATVVAAVEESCRAETVELYAREGVEDRLGEAGLPPALTAWLLESSRKVLGEGGYREKAARRLRLQTQRLERLLAKTQSNEEEFVGAPAAVLKNIQQCFLERTETERTAKQKPLLKKLEVWALAREKHVGQLRETDDVKALSEAESGRSAEAQAAVTKVRDEILEGLTESALEFTDELFKQTKATMLIMDNTLLTEDLGWLPGDEFLEERRKSLKRLRKAQRLAKAPQKHSQDPSNPYGSGPGREFETREWPPPTLLLRREEEAGEEEEPPVVLPLDDRLLATFAEIAKSPQSSFLTTAHRVLVRARDSRLEEFFATYRAALSEVKEQHGKFYDDETELQAEWDKLLAEKSQEPIAQEEETSEQQPPPAD